MKLFTRSFTLLILGQASSLLGNGALRVSARAFAEEVAAVEKEIREFLQQ